MKEKQSRMLLFLYQTFPGRILLRGLTHPAISKAAGAFLNTRCSVFLIKHYVRHYQMDLTPYEAVPYRSFNQFFTRKIRPETRPFPVTETELPSPCDGKLTVYPITREAQFQVKGRRYTVAELLRDPQLAEQFEGGYGYILRLTVDNYHRYHYFDDGEKGENIFLPGKLHTVRPVALENAAVFGENSREYTVLDTEHFGRAVQMEVGALLVGRIKNHHPAGRIQRGAEKGMFEFGGSTVILLFQKDSIIPESMLLERTAAGEETPIRCGAVIGRQFQQK